VSCQLTVAGFSRAGGEGCASGLLPLPPADGERPSRLDRIDVLIERKVGLAALIHEAITPWLVMAAHRQGGGHWRSPGIELSLAGWIGLGLFGDHH
jgi:hypothetical protein